MSRARCSFCLRRYRDGTATIYAATTYPSGLRLSHRYYLCVDCTTAQLLPLIKGDPFDAAVEAADTCVVCDKSVTEDRYYYWFSVFPPHGERSDHEAQLCFEHHAKLVESVSEHAQRLPDRELTAREAKPVDPVWALLAG